MTTMLQHVPILSSDGVMRGLVPRIHVLGKKRDVDGRDKHGHDAKPL
jgi:hypothetical protein